MAKLGLKITRSQGGFTFGLGVNEDTFWTRYIRDLRDDCRALSDFNPGSRVIMLSSNSSGNLLVVVSLTESRPGEMICAWIHLPVSIAVSGEELAWILEAVGEELATGSPDGGRLQDLFERDYPVNPVAMSVYKSSGDALAFRYYGEGCRYQLPELLGVSISQPEYQRFKEVFFIDKHSGIRADRGSDLSNSAMQECVVLFPPEESFGFRPYADGEVFDTPRSFAEGARVRLIWKRQGYKSVEKIIDVDASNPNVQPLGMEEVFKYVTYDSIQVMDDRHCALSDYTLRVNNKILEKGMMLAVREIGIHEVPVVVSSEGFNAFDGVLDLSAPVTVTLEKKTWSYTFVLPVEGFEDERIQLVSEVPLEQSPVRGYDADGAPVPNVTNYLKYRPEMKNDTRKILLWVFCGVVAGLLLGWLLSSSLNSATIDRLRSENSALRASQGSPLPVAVVDSLQMEDSPADSLAEPVQRPVVLTTESRKAEARKEADAKKADREAARKARLEEKAARKAAKAAHREAARRAAAEAKASKAAARERAKWQKDSVAKAEAAAKAREVSAKNAAKARKDSLAKAEAESKAAEAKAAQEARAAQERKAAEEKAEAERKASVVKASPDLVLYLDNSAKWEKGKMESFGEVPGLWDALNARDFDKILSYEETLEESTRFTALCKSVKELRKIPGKHFTQNYCVDPNDTEITFTGYQNKIDGKLRDLKGF